MTKQKQRTMAGLIAAATKRKRKIDFLKVLENGKLKTYEEITAFYYGLSHDQKQRLAFGYILHLNQIDHLSPLEIFSLLQKNGK